MYMKNNTVEINAETVEKWHKTLDWIYATLIFWKLDDKWPTNLIKDVLDELCKEIVSVSHINDK